MRVIVFWNIIFGLSNQIVQCKEFLIVCGICFLFSLLPFLYFVLHTCMNPSIKFKNWFLIKEGHYISIKN